jgi:hypothetical protein
VSARCDGGPAFPVVDHMGDGDEGMTLRDYFATHSVQPGCGEVATMAGLVWRGGLVWADKDTSLGNFDTWFNALPLHERLSLFSRVKYAMADAMLAARSQP